MTTLVVPFHCDGGADGMASALGLQKSGSEWIGDCPACKRSKVLSVRPSRDGHAAHVVCVCRGACMDAAAFRAALSELLGLEFPAHPQRHPRMSPDLLTWGGEQPRRRE